MRWLRRLKLAVAPLRSVWTIFTQVVEWVLASRHEISGNVHVRCEEVNVNVHQVELRPDGQGVPMSPTSIPGSGGGLFQRRRLRGAKPTPRHKLAAARPFQPVGVAPPQFVNVPAVLSMWGNSTYGDCVTAEEAFAKACSSPEIFVDDATVIAWARQNGFLNGADLLTVIQAMQQSGFVVDGTTYDDGSPSAVDYTNATQLQNAICQGPVKIGVAADQLENVVGNSNGWFGVGFQQDQNEDHCVSLCGYGSIAWLASQLGVSVPAGIDGSQPGYALFTWATIGIIDAASMLAITGEAWLRTPTTLIDGPVPVPVPTPTPNPPAPTPAGVGVLSLASDTPAGTYALVPASGAIQGGGSFGTIPWAQIIAIIIAILQQYLPPPTPTPSAVRRKAG